jgi:hypothetical protein
MPAPLFRPTPGQTYESLRADFRYEIPARFNLGIACSDVHDPAAVALVSVASTGRCRPRPSENSPR